MAKSFEEFKLNRQILNAVADAGYTVATPIQEKAIAPVLSGQDIFGIAETGTGKTAAFVLPILMQLKYAQGDNPRALILSPTRELAMQIAEQVKLFFNLYRFTVAGYFWWNWSENTKRADSQRGRYFDCNARKIPGFILGRRY